MAITHTTQKSFKLTNNSKTRGYNNHNNTFSLAQGLPEKGGTCPCATKGKGGCLEVCYAANLRKLYKNYANVEDANAALIRDLLPAEMEQVIRNSVFKWWLSDEGKSPYFRIHTAGDFFSIEYARSWAKVINEFPNVKFWVYTRSLFAVPYLKDCKNLTIMLSCDPVNQAEVVREYNQNYMFNKNIAIAYMGSADAFPKDDLLDNRPMLVCPEITGKLKPGKDECGACLRCRACVDRTLKSGEIRNICLPIHR